jgi:hypothetical protein
MVSGAIQVFPGILAGFENDGNMVLAGDTLVGTLDWENVDDDPDFLEIIDDTLDTGVAGKEQEPELWACNLGGNSPPKANILRAYVNQRMEGGDTFVDLAWVRENDNGQGNTHVNFEFNQVSAADPPPTTAPCAKTNRVDGDLLITYDMTPVQDVNQIVIEARTWNSATGEWEAFNGFTVDDIKAAVNSDAIPDLVADPNGGVIVNARRFGEASINLTEVLEDDDPEVECFGFGQVNVRSRSSGETFNSNLQDRLPSAPVNLTNCGQIVINKVTDPAGSTQEFDFDVEDGNGDPITDSPFTATDAANATTGFIAPGTYSVDEIVPDGWTLEDGAFCDDGDGGNDIDPADITLVAGQTITCTFTNSLDRGTLQVVKDIVPGSVDPDPGVFDLFIEADQVADDAGDGQGNDAIEVTAGDYTVSEQAGTDTNLDDYSSSITCRVGTDIVAGPTAGTTIEAPVGDDEDVVCTITNTRETGRLTVVKDIQGDSGDDSFDLLIGTDTVVDNGGDGASFSDTVNTGTYTVSEAAGDNTNLDDYTSSISCVDAQDVEVASDDDTDVDVTVGTDQAIVCTITNVRETGRLTVVKDIQGDSGDDSFDLLIGTDTVVDNGGDGASFSDTVNTGTYTVSEAAGDNTVLADYTSSIECRNAADEVVASGAGTSLDVTVGTDQAIVCTIVNSRDTGRLTVIKQLEPANDPGLFNLLIDGAVEAANVGDEGTTGAHVLNSGVHTVAEAAGDNTDLADYTSSLECVDASDAVVPSTNGEVTINEGDAIVCTFTNVAVPKQGTIIVKKVADEYDTGKEFPFSSNFDGDANDGTDFTLKAGDQQAFVLDAGTYSVKELVPTGWDLVSAICSDQSPANAINLAAEETVTCVFTNKKSTYDQYPGDDDFDFDTPFDDAGDPGTPAPNGDTAGTNDQVGTQQPAAPAPVVENSTTSQPQPDPAAPVALDQLPRTGHGLDRVTMVGGMMLILGGLSVYLGRRRRANQA